MPNFVSPGWFRSKRMIVIINKTQFVPEDSTLQINRSERRVIFNQVKESGRGGAALAVEERWIRRFGIKRTSRLHGKL